MKKFVAFCLLAALVLALAGCAAADQEPPVDADASPVAGKKVAYIMQMAPSDIFEMWAQSAQETATALGMEFQAFFCDGSDEQWQDTVAQCAAEGYDCLLYTSPRGGIREKILLVCNIENLLLDFRAFIYLLALHQSAAFIRAENACRHPQKSAFTSAISAQQAKGAAPLDSCIHMVHGADIAEIFSEPSGFNHF